MKLQKMILFAVLFPLVGWSQNKACEDLKKDIFKQAQDLRSYRDDMLKIESKLYSSLLSTKNFLSGYVNRRLYCPLAEADALLNSAKLVSKIQSLQLKRTETFRNFDSTLFSRGKDCLSPDASAERFENLTQKLIASSESRSESARTLFEAYFTIFHGYGSTLNACSHIPISYDMVEAANSILDLHQLSVEAIQSDTKLAAVYEKITNNWLRQ